LARLRAGAVRLLANGVLVWLLAGVFALRDLGLGVLVVVGGVLPDTETFLAGGRAYLNDPGHLYDAVIARLATLHTVPPPGGLDAFLSPPAAAVLAVPFALLGEMGGVRAWAAVDAMSLVVGLVILYRLLDPSGVAAAAFCLIAAYFPPAFADVSSGQRGGFILLLVMIAVALERRRPALAGAFAGLAAAIKLYSGGMLIGPAPRRRVAFGAGLLGTFAVTSAAAFIPLGVGGPLRYARDVLIPVSAAEDPNCGYLSVHELFTRAVGGAPYLAPGPGGFRVLASPLHAPELATILAAGTLLGLIVAAVWAARRSGWSPLYGLTVGFSLGALLPTEAFPYQFLPLLPLVLVVATQAIALRRLGTLLAIAVCLLGFAPQPCDLPFPNLWTVFTLALFVVCLASASMFNGEDDNRA
jgi:hypothetical protein